MHYFWTCSSSIVIFKVERMATDQVSQHAVKVLASLREMMKDGFACDFVIKVGNSTFPVHRNVLAACSDYFKAMLSHKSTKEVKEGLVDMQDVEAQTVKQCIDFIYTGQTTITFENAYDILHAAGLMQLTGLTDLCFSHLLNHMTADNCFEIRSLASTFNHEQSADTAEKYAMDNFENVITTEGFANLERGEVTHLLMRSFSQSCGVLWKAVTIWIEFNEEERKQHLMKLMTVLDLSNFSFSFVLTTIWSSRIMKDTEECKQLVLNRLFSDDIELRDCMTMHSCILIKKIWAEYNPLPIKNVDVIVDNFMAKNFDSVSKTDYFVTVPENDIVKLFKSVKCIADAHLSQEQDKLKWTAALKWTMHDRERRKNTFPELLKTLRFNWSAAEFVRSTVRVEPLVEESHDCKNIIMDLLCCKLDEENKNRSLGTSDGVKHEPCTDLTHYILLLDRKNRDVRGYNLLTEAWCSLLNVPLVSTNSYSAIVSLKDRLYFLNNKTLYCLQNNLTWQEKSDLTLTPDKSAKLVAFDDCIYVVSKSFLSYYKPTGNRWVEMRQPDDFENAFCLAQLGKYLYCFGGYPMSNKACRYNPQEINWSDIEPMLQQRSNASAAEKNGYIFVMGGRSAEIILRSVEFYDQCTDSWTVVTSMQIPRFNFASCVVGGKLYAVGGHNSIEVFDEETQEWDVIGCINSRPFGISSCGFSCWVVKTQRSDGETSQTVVLL